MRLESLILILRLREKGCISITLIEKIKLLIVIF